MMIRVCHGTRIWLFLLAVACAPPAFADDPDNCLACHGYRGLSAAGQDGQVRLFYVDPSMSIGHRGPHARLACTDCHDQAEVSVIPHRVTTQVDCARTCHLVNPDGSQQRFSHEPIAEVLARSAHKPETLADLEFSDGALLRPGQSQCLYCHDEPVFRDALSQIPAFQPLGGRTFDRCQSCHADQLSVDVAYVLQHIATRLQPARPAIESGQICAVCHSDERILARFEMHDAVASYWNSFHGKATLLGNEKAAQCVQCHVASGSSVHAMLAGSDPRSSVHPQQIANSCRSTDCHPGASAQLADATMHLDLAEARDTLEFFLAATFVGLTVVAFIPWVLLSVFELLHGALATRKRLHDPAIELAERLLDTREGRKRLKRYTPFQRGQHWFLAITFTILCVTGLPQRFAGQPWAATIVSAFGGLEVNRAIHHGVGVALLIGLLGHLVYVVALIVMRMFPKDGPRRGFFSVLTSLPMWLTIEDLRRTVHLGLYFVFLTPRPPAAGRFSLKEKFGYLAVFWGTVMLGVTGLLLWAEQWASHLITGRLFSLSLIAHTYEAILAASHIVILHLIDVLLAPHAFPISPAMAGGRTPAEKLGLWHRSFVEEVAADLGVEAAE